jgi:signal transduction histidine kinase
MVTLEASRLFRRLSAPELQALRQIAQERKFSAGQEIFKEGDKGDGIYLVKDGQVQISFKIAENVQRVFAQLGPGELFGEMAVLEFKPRSASATAAQTSTVYFIPRDELLVMVERSPVLSLELLREISQRLRDFNQRYIHEILQTERLTIIGRFARSIVHDLKNPLNIIGLTAELTCSEKSTPEARQKSVVTIRKQVDRVSEMVNEILDFTQGTSADYVLGLNDYGLFVQQILEELRPDLEVRGAQLIAGAPPVSVRVAIDPKRLRRVFLNLVHNATDAMPRGGKIFMRFRVVGLEMITEIEDTGPGVAPEMAGHLFEAFATFGKAHGTGLGLSISKKIIDDHHGRIWAQNQPPRGAIFCFALPLPKDSLNR